VARANRILLAAVGAIVLTVLLAALFATQRTDAEYPSGTPVGVVQSYLTAIADHDTSTAFELLADSTHCTFYDLASAHLPDSFRADLGEHTQSATTARVTVRITESDDDPFGTGWEHDEAFTLVREGDQWRLSGDPWPLWGSCT
jgi:hypothetical protein